MNFCFKASTKWVHLANVYPLCTIRYLGELVRLCQSKFFRPNFWLMYLFFLCACHSLLCVCTQSFRRRLKWWALYKQALQLCWGYIPLFFQFWACYTVLNWASTLLLEQNKAIHYHVVDLFLSMVHGCFHVLFQSCWPTVVQLAQTLGSTKTCFRRFRKVALRMVSGEVLHLAGLITAMLQLARTLCSEQNFRFRPGWAVLRHNLWSISLSCMSFMWRTKGQKTGSGQPTHYFSCLDACRALQQWRGIVGM